MLIEVDRIAKAEHRTRSDLIREALRVYMFKFKRDENIMNPAIRLTATGVTTESNGTE